MTDKKRLTAHMNNCPGVNRNFIDFFTGSWRVIRTINNAIGPDLNVKGDAKFTPDTLNLNQLHYREHMIIESQKSPLSDDSSHLNKPIVATQEYLYHCIQNHSENTIQVFFQNSNVLFHQFTLIGALSTQNLPITISATPHLCGQDLYSTLYTFLNIHTFEIKYTVIGPNKNYVSKTLFNRMI